MAKFAVLAVLVSNLIVACGGSSKPAPREPAQPVASNDDPTCPVTISGTSVSTEDTANGAALVFMTTGDLLELRKRVGAMANLHNEHHLAMGPLPTGAETTDGGGHDHHAHHGSGSATGDHAKHGGQAGSMIDVHSKATSEDVEGGAKLVFVAFPTGISKIQSEPRMHAQHLATGTCKMDH